jgi:hypothetical protein
VRPPRPAPAASRRRVVAARAALIAAVAAPIALEAGTAAAFQWPGAWRGRVPAGLEATLLRYHEGFLMGPPLQFRRECSEPDAVLLYRLRPGACRFDSDEFDTAVRVSARHLREDRETVAPDFVALGDSVALGWGVEREQAFPALLAAQAGGRETVVAHSSYGTVRELLLLRRLALRDFGAVVVQYSANDLRENRAFLASGRHQPASRAEWERAVALVERIQGKRFMRHARHWFALAWSDLLVPRSREPEAPGEEHARDLLRVLSAFAPDLRGRPLVVFGEGLGVEERRFVRALQEAAVPPGLGPLRATVVADRLAPSDRFTLDPHWRASGHGVAAAALAAPLRDALASAP